MASPIIPIVLAGGAGTRLWPVSRDALFQAIPALDRQQVDLPGNAAACAGCDVCTAYCYHRPQLSFLCATSGRRNRRRRDDHHRADAARFGANGSTGLGGITNLSMQASVFRSNAPLSSRAASSHCRGMVIALSIGSSFAALRK
jgi:nucleotidyltransferase-like protein